MKKMLSIILIAILSFPLSGCKSNKNNIHAIKYNLDTEPKTLDPQAATDVSANTVILNIFEGLTRLDEDENPTPAAAEKWENNDNFTVFTFYIRKNLTWANKEKAPLTSKDFAFGIKRALDKNANCPLSYKFHCIKNAKNFALNSKTSNSLGIEIVDDYIIKFSLEDPNEDFPKLLATPAAMPCNEEFFYSCAGQYGLSHTAILCNGPFKIKHKYGWEHFKNLTLVKNDAYQGPNETCVENINFTIGQNFDNLVDSIKNETLDAGLLNLDEVEKAREKNLTILPFADIIWCIAFNCSNEIFANLNMRKAILSSLNREFILNTLPPESSIADKFMPVEVFTESSQFQNFSDSRLFFNENSNPDDYLKNGLAELNLKTLPNITITCLDTSETRTIISNMLENLNEKLNTNFNMNPKSYRELLASINNSNYQVALIPIVIDTNSAVDFLSMFKSDNKSNLPKYKNPSYDKLLDNAKSANPKDSTKLLIDAEKLLLSQAVLYPMFKQKQFFAINPNLKGIIVHKYKAGIDFTHVKKA
ncbi:MAG: peptide ABC transporter substrate-binding protein [Clostridia bacterium]|nr:peptide ABC transporter substrate-binding protein [Clostridia bacterium]